MCQQRQRRSGALTPADREEIRIGVNTAGSPTLPSAGAWAGIGARWDSEIAANGGRAGYRAVAGEVRAAGSGRPPSWSGARAALGCGRTCRL